jgi:CheY-like chemotaxis protein
MLYENPSCYILLVEDNPLDADLTRRALQKSDPNIRLDMARDGEEALAFLKRWEKGVHPPIFVLLDMKLPKVDGLEVLRAIKTHTHFKILPVVMLTSSNEISDIHQAYMLGANSYIVKAIDYDEFTKAVMRIRDYWCGLNVHPE